MIPFNKSGISGNEEAYISDAIRKGRLSSGGFYTKRCESFLNDKFRSDRVLLTSSCSSALEISALLLDLKPSDEVIVPSFTFVTSALAFSMNGAKVIFADIDPKTLNISPETIAPLINSKTKAIVVVHYAGVSCKMDEIMKIAQSNNLYVIEDAALGFDAYYKSSPLGTIGDLGTFSFHDTKNIGCGEGGALVINNPEFTKRAQIIRDKGTNRKEFEDQTVSKYECVDIGSSYSMSELNAAFLFGQFENLEKITKTRVRIWEEYKNKLTPLEDSGDVNLPFVPGNCTTNGSTFYLLCNSETERNQLINHLNQNGIRAVFHYQPLHSSPYYSKLNGNIELPVSSNYAHHILRLPLYNSLSIEDQSKVIESVVNFFN